MPTEETVHIDVRDITLLSPAGEPMTLATLTGIQLIILMRHRH